MTPQDPAKILSYYFINLWQYILWHWQTKKVTAKEGMPHRYWGALVLSTQNIWQQKFRQFFYNDYGQISTAKRRLVIETGQFGFHKIIRTTTVLKQNKNRPKEGEIASPPAR